MARIPSREFTVHAQFIGIECTITPKVLVFGPSKPGTAVGTIELSSKEHFAITNTSSTDSDVEIHTDSTAQSAKHALRILLTGKAQPGNKLGKITVLLKEGPQSESRDIPFYGTVAQ